MSFFKFILNSYKSQFLIIIFLIILDALVGIFSIISIAPVIDIILSNEKSDLNVISTFLIKFFKTENIFFFISIFFFFNFLNAIFKIYIYHKTLKIKFSVLQNLNIETLKGFINSNWSNISNYKTSYVLNTLQRESEQLGISFMNFAIFFSSIFQLLLYLVAPLIINHQLVLIVIILISFFSFPIFLIKKHIYKLGKNTTLNSNKSTEALEQTLSNIKFIIANNLNNLFINKYTENYRNYLNSSNKAQSIVYAIPALFYPFAILTVLITLSYSIKLEISFSLTGVILWSLFKILPIANSIVTTRSAVNTFLASFEQIYNLLNISSKKDIRNNRNLEKFIDLEKFIEFKDVSFNFNDNEKIFVNENFKIKSLTTIGIIGKIGVGKSTLIDLIIGLQEPKSGSIFYDNLKLKDIDLVTLRDKISYMTQDTVIFNMSLKDNINLNSTNTDQKFFNEICAISGVKELADKFNDKYDTLLGENGVALSGGQRQQVALARALIRKPKILILDEFTSSLDKIAKNNVLEKLKKMNKNFTTIVVSHDLSIFEITEECLVLEKGQKIRKLYQKEFENNVRYIEHIKEIIK